MPHRFDLRRVSWLIELLLILVIAGVIWGVPALHARDTYAHLTAL
jgi:hypothetical protein